LRDLRGSRFTEEIVDPLLTSGGELVNELTEFFGYLDSMQAELKDMGLPELLLTKNEINERIGNAREDWVTLAGRQRTRFGLDFGQFAHGRFKEGIIAEETSRKRIRDVHYGAEYEMKHPDGKKVQYDYVDFEKHLIVDYKSANKGQTEKEVGAAYTQQRQRHIDAYFAAFGVVPSYKYVTYPSSKDLFFESDGPGGNSKRS